MLDWLGAHLQDRPLILILDGVPLAKVHFFFCFAGALLCLVVMQLISTGRIKFAESCPVAYYVRRASLGSLALSMCWAMLYSTFKDWQPWPPEFAIVLSIDLMLATSVWVALKPKVPKTCRRLIGRRVSPGDFSR